MDIWKGQFVDVAPNDVISGTSVEGTLLLEGTAWNTVVNNGGYMIIDPSGHAHFTTLNAGAHQVDHGYAYGTTITGQASNYAWQYVDKDGQADGTVIHHFGAQEVDGWVDNTMVYYDGHQDLHHGGAAAHTSVYNGGEQYVDGNAVSWWTNIYKGGLELVAAGGIARYTTVSGGNSIDTGDLWVQASGTANSATINNYGVEDLYGTDNSATVNGGKQLVWSGGTANNATVKGGGLQFVEAGGTANSTTIGVNGDERVQAGGTANVVLFGGTNAMLDLDSADSVTGPIVGFQHLDQIDLRNVHFGSGTTASFWENGANTGGVLTISDGTSVAKMTLLGQYTSGEFALTSDGHGGTFVNDNPMIAGDWGFIHFFLH